MFIAKKIVNDNIQWPTTEHEEIEIEHDSECDFMPLWITAKDYIVTGF